MDGMNTLDRGEIKNSCGAALDDMTGGMTRTKSSPNFEQDTTQKCHHSEHSKDPKSIESSSTFHNRDRTFTTLIRTSSTIIPKPIHEKLDLPSCIFSNSVYLGDCFQATNRKSIDYLKITHIVNCTKNIENKFEKNHVHHSHHGEKIIHSQNSDPIENSLEDQCVTKNDLEQDAMMMMMDKNNNTLNADVAHVQANDGTLNDIKYMRVAIDDDKNAPISQYFQECFDFIEEAISNSGVVLVHCAAGVSRSSSIVISYVMKKMGVGFLFAFQLVKKRRRMIMPNEGFFKQLMEYEKQLNGGRTRRKCLEIERNWEMDETFRNMTVATTTTTQLQINHSKTTIFKFKALTISRMLTIRDKSNTPRSSWAPPEYDDQADLNFSFTQGCHSFKKQKKTFHTNC
ncbi:hypothetical protein C9374_002886 [Naegleria lovaniensis]|uniref:protein-tyrosine-phosphatase n=1 Tax=Naegleria lovaniensis TaxID=51637 RepID=A0AA88KPU2_NAELO|nr:uncharacterized protein C9374_002886 [Naegleria lovaniensis]KAG2385737.1 hypothetical protein C9374_002886 [Naegleria lovaniensis]